jgi:hypothetical protein
MTQRFLSSCVAALALLAGCGSQSPVGADTSGVSPDPSQSTTSDDGSSVATDAPTDAAGCCTETTEPGSDEPTTETTVGVADTTVGSFDGTDTGESGTAVDETTGDTADADTTTDGVSTTGPIAEMDPMAFERFSCPEGMKLVPLKSEPFCMDAYERSWGNATTTDLGGAVGTRSDGWPCRNEAFYNPSCLTCASAADIDLCSAAGNEILSVPGAVAINDVSMEEVRLVCTHYGHRLCMFDEWRTACHGLSGTRFGWGDEYQPRQCFHTRDSGCEGGLSAPVSDGPDPKYKRCKLPLYVTGIYPECVNDLGIHDLIGGIPEVVALPYSASDVVPALMGGLADSFDLSMLGTGPTEPSPDCDWFYRTRPDWSSPEYPKNGGVRCCADAAPIAASFGP